MAEYDSNEEQHAALIKAIEITKRDAEFNAENPPVGILQTSKMEALKKSLLELDPKAFHNKILSAEKDREILKKDLKRIIKLDLLLKFPYNVGDRMMFDGALKKYKMMFDDTIKKYKSDFEDMPDIKLISYIGMIFPDILHSSRMKYSKDDSESPIYKNFKSIHVNLGILGLLPKGKKYGGFVKALLHEEMELICFPFAVIDDDFLALCRTLYHSSITPHDKRAKWFEKLEITESDCALWTRIFNFYFPELADVHKYFGQIA